MGNLQRVLLISALSFLLAATLVWAEEDDERSYKCPDNLGIFPNENDRSTYWICVNFVPFQQKCPHPLEFDARYKQCKLSETYILQQYKTTPRYYPTSRAPNPTGRYGTTRRYDSTGQYQTTRRATTDRYPTVRYQTTRRVTQFPTTRRGTQFLTTRQGTRYPATGQGTRFPTTRRGTRFPTTRRGTQFPTTRRGTQFPTTRRGTQFPTTRQGTRYPATGRGTQFPTTDRYSTDRYQTTRRFSTGGYPVTSRYGTTPRYNYDSTSGNYWTGRYETSPRYWPGTGADSTSDYNNPRTSSRPVAWTSADDDGWEVEKGTQAPQKLQFTPDDQ